MKKFFIVSSHEVVRNLCCAIPEAIFHEEIRIFEKGKPMKVVSAWEVTGSEIISVWSSASTQDVRLGEFKVAVRREKNSTSFRWAQAIEWNPAHISQKKKLDTLLTQIRRKVKK